ncbi:unnamed protein product [Phytophthora lilii]|uniref:Unnamed protein product n=1 Tax=Phytophthora lilii TaxID=2077276 RepID=A0A9W6XED5_9STRA|nr:unnamed protein product [Phytophthora lilii]
MNVSAPSTRRVRLEMLQRLLGEGKRAELQKSIAAYSTKELRSLCGGFGVPAQSKEYAAYQSKAGYAELLLKLLEAKAASSADGAEFVRVAGAASGRTRKTKNCSLRLVNVLFSEALGAQMDLAACKKRTANGNSPFWEKVRAEFVSTKTEYAKVAFADEVFLEYNLASPVAHSSEKLRKMWDKLALAYTSVFSRFAIAGDKEADLAAWDTEADLAACAGRIDVYYLRRWLNVKPKLLGMLCKLPRETDVAAQCITPSPRQNAPQNVLQSVQPIQPSMQQTNLQPTVQQQHLMSLVAAPVVEPVARVHVPNREDEGDQLMKSIKLAYDVLAVLPEADRKSEIEHTVRRRLLRCAKRLKRIEDEEEKSSMMV